MFWIKYSLNIIINGLLFVALFGALQYAFYTVMPTSYWFKYYDIKPQKEVFISSDDLRFNTFFNFNHVFNGSAIHQLRCKTKDTDEYIFYSDQVNEFGRININQKEGSFIYSETKPEPPRKCYLQSEIRAELPYGIIKTQKIIGKYFEIQ